MTASRAIHILHLHEGDRFRYRPDGEVFVLAVERGEKDKPIRYFAVPADRPGQLDAEGRPARLAAEIEWRGCFVHPEIDEGHES